MSSAKAWEASDQLGNFKQDISVKYNLDTLNEDKSTRLKLGMSHLKFGRYQEALNEFQKIFDMDMQEGSQWEGYPVLFDGMGACQMAIGKFAIAETYYTQALEASEKLYGPHHRSTHKARLNLLRNELNLIDHKRIKNKLESLENDIRTENRESDSLLGYVQSLRSIIALKSGLVGDSLRHAIKALPYLNPQMDQEELIKVVRLIGVLNYALGDYDKAMEMLSRAYQLAANTPNPEDDAILSCDLGDIYMRQGLLNKAEDAYGRHCTVSRELKNRECIQRCLFGLGRVAVENKKFSAAESYFSDALQYIPDDGGKYNATAREYGYHMAEMFITEGNMDKAFIYAESALLNDIALGLGGIADDWKLLARIAEGKHQPEAAIFFGKMCVNSFQRQRENLAGLSNSLKDSFMKTYEQTYTQLTSLLTGRGRLVEAQEVIGMHREAELYDFMTRDSDKDPRTTKVDFIGDEQELASSIGMMITGIDGNFDYARLLTLEEINSHLPEVGMPQLEGHLLFTRQSTSQLHSLLINVQKHLEGLRPEHNGTVLKSQLGLINYLKPVLNQMDNTSALVHTIIDKDGIWLILATKDQSMPRQYRTIVNYGELSHKILNFRQLICDHKADPKPLAKELYDIIIRPMEAELSKKGIKTLLISLDGPLRYLPIAALHDGSRWFIEKYAVSLFTDAAKDNIKIVDIDWRLAGFGTTKGHGEFRPLPAVGDELASIVKRKGCDSGVIPGQYYLDEDFNENRLKNVLNDEYSVVHIATHFDFKPGAVYNSTILLGDGTNLSLERLGSDDFRFDNKDMLTLSACNTAMTTRGNGSEMEGFSAMVQRKGIQSVMATLWPVADDTTKNLMVDFYRNKYERYLTKAEALRQAQLNMVRKGTKTRYRDTTHPYYWAPFVLMGNWH